MRLLIVAFMLLNVDQLITAHVASNKLALTPEPTAEEQALEKRTEVERLNTQVDRLIGEGKFDEAMPLANRAFELSESAFGPADAAVANAATNLAGLYIAKGKSVNADPLLLRAIEVNDVVRHPADPILTKTLEMYTCVLSRKEQDDKLKEFDQERLAMLARSAEPDRFWGALWRATKVIRIPKPEYPGPAKGVAEGRILVEVAVNEEGNVIRAQSMCGGNVLLTKVSEQAAKKAQFMPVLIAGKPIRIIGYLLYRFAHD
jgi:hypothetical protein